jgi:hypothetical protein
MSSSPTRRVSYSRRISCLLDGSDAG